ncbi:hypothetical protein GCM10011515_20430 [Tsuneonella deserti]|uniref:YlxR domain-containing protein n=1 Tax=Tsuneonella deserti TaxID=2035528 RepID=A0ABQ1SBG3_9SPHN|nr:DUF448 domain-containing protein [Tsuneonella deserti]GGE00531.1 hypothetical protein GCM10011515_20430 [Tsuneonella deserti]
MRTPNNERLTSDIAEASSQRGRGGASSAEASPRARKSEPERRCILSGEHGGRGELVRLAISPDGLVLPDPLARAPGRGAWLGVSRGELEAAMGAGKGGGKLKGALTRAFKGAALTVPDDLPQLVEDGLRRVLLDRLGLEMRAGHLILGSERIAEHARGGAVELLLHASDASSDGSRKLDQAWRVGSEAEGSGLAGTVLPLDRAALSVAMGRDNVVHMALADPAAAARVSLALSRLMHFLGGKRPMTDPDEPALAGTDD